MTQSLLVTLAALGAWNLLNLLARLWCREFWLHRYSPAYGWQIVVGAWAAIALVWP